MFTGSKNIKKTNSGYATKFQYSISAFKNNSLCSIELLIIHDYKNAQLTLHCWNTVTFCTKIKN